MESFYSFQMYGQIVKLLKAGYAIKPETVGGDRLQVTSKDKKRKYLITPFALNKGFESWAIGRVDNFTASGGWINDRHPFAFLCCAVTEEQIIDLTK